MEPETRLPTECKLFPGRWLISPCLESGCTRNVTECALYQGPPKTQQKVFIPQKALPWEPEEPEEKPYRCQICGRPGPDGFYPGNRSTCSKCQNIQRSVRYARAKRNGAPILSEVTRICSECGAEYTKLKVQTRRHKCPRCREVEGLTS